MKTPINTHTQPVYRLADTHRRTPLLLCLGAAAAVLHLPALASGGVAASDPRAAAAVVAKRSTAEEVNTSRQALTKVLVLQCTRDADCATVGVGARACGGPEQYLAYAVRDTPPAALQQANERYAALRKKLLEERGEMSTCEVLPDPGAQCSSAGLCQVPTPPGGRRGGLPGAQAR